MNPGLIKGEILIKRFLDFSNKNAKVLEIIFFLCIIALGIFIRLGSIDNLKDVSNNNYIPLETDPFIFLRYAKDIVENGQLPEIDNLRYAPLGIETTRLKSILPYVLAWVNKFLSLFNNQISIDFTTIIYPVVFSSLGLVFFYLLIRKLFGITIALLSSAFLVVIPTYLQRTMLGFSDKEALGLFLMYALLYFYVAARYSNKIRNVVFLSTLSGVSAGLMQMTWGVGPVVIYMIGFLSILDIILLKFKGKNNIILLSFTVSYFVILTIASQLNLYSFIGLVKDASFQLLLLALVLGLLLECVYKNQKILNIITFHNKIPPILASILFIAIIANFLNTIIWNQTIIQKLLDLINAVFASNDIALLTSTISESIKPYFINHWIPFFNIGFIIIFVIGSIFVFYKTLDSVKLKSLRIVFTIIYSLIPVIAILGRYSSTGFIDPNASRSETLLLVVLVILLITLITTYFYTYYKSSGKINYNIKWNFIFCTIWFIFALMLAQTAIRFLMFLAPVASVTFSLLIVKIYQLMGSKWKISYLVIIILLLIGIPGLYDGIYTNLAKVGYREAKAIEPLYTEQWQQSMAWVRENTLKDSVFANWWDTGYFIQTGANRATILDPGNLIPKWNHMLGRYVHAGKSERTSLEFLKSHNTNYLLIEPEEVSKYYSISRVGSNGSLDIWSWASLFSVDKTRSNYFGDKKDLFYSGLSPTDHDIIIQDRLLPKYNTFIYGVVLNMDFRGDIFSIKGAKIMLVYNNRNLEMPVNCVYLDEYLILAEDNDRNGCIRILPNIVDGKLSNNLLDTSALYIPEKMKDSLLSRLYIFDEQVPNYELVYKDDNQLSVLDGKILGPIRIWKINYPQDIVKKEEYLAF